jgi:hypothetical protein
MMSALMQIAIYNDNITLFNDIIEKYRANLEKVICVGNDWCIAETKRDITHAQFLLGGIAQVPEMAFHQGLNIFDKRLIKAFENHALILLNEVPDGISRNDIKTPYGLWAEPVWEIAYNHFKTRTRQSGMENTRRLLEKIRPERVTFHWGGGTLTHYER